MLIGFLALVLAGPLAIAQSLTMVSVTPNGAAGNHASGNPEISADGRWIVFHSESSDIVPGDQNGKTDAFLRDLVSNQTIRISRGLGGTEANESSGNATISDDGTIIVFESLASNLVVGDTNAAWDVFVYNRISGAISLVSASPNGSIGHLESTYSQVSRNGRYVSFSSASPNLAPPDTNGRSDVFVRDLRTGLTVMASRTESGGQIFEGAEGPAVSESGRYVVFTTYGAISTNDTNGTADVYKKDIRTGSITLVSASAAGVAGSHHSAADSRRPMSDDGRYVSFVSHAYNLVPNDTNQSEDVFLKDTLTGSIHRVSVGDQGQQGNRGPFSHGMGNAISGDGRFVVFSSAQPNLVPNDLNGQVDVFLRDTFAQTTTLISEGRSGSSANHPSLYPRINGGATLVTYVSSATDLPCPTPANGWRQAYVHDRQVVIGHTQHLPGGCQGVNETPTLSATPPVLGSTVTISGKHLEPNTIGAALWSMPTISPTATFGDCSIYIDLSSFFILSSAQADASGDWTISLPVPSAREHAGIEFNVQGLFLTSNPAVLALTDGIKVTVGY